MGRPRGSKNKPKSTHVTVEKRPRGRPCKLVNAQLVVQDDQITTHASFEFMEIDEDETITSETFGSRGWSSDETFGLDQFSIGMDAMY